MTVTDHDIDSHLRQLVQLAPDEAVWPAIEQGLHPRARRMARLRGKLRFAFGGGFAAILALSLALFHSRFEVEFSERGAATVETGAPRYLSAAQQRSHAKGKYVRHLYAGEEALWDAMLEEEVNLVDQTMLYSSPQEQRMLWQYRNKLTRQLEAVRYMAIPEKYLF